MPDYPPASNFALPALRLAMSQRYQYYTFGVILVSNLSKADAWHAIEWIILGDYVTDAEAYAQLPSVDYQDVYDAIVTAFVRRYPKEAQEWVMVDRFATILVPRVRSQLDRLHDAVRRAIPDHIKVITNL